VDPYNEKYERDSLDLASEIINLADKGIDTETDFIVAPETAIPGKGNFNLNALNSSFLLNGMKNHYLNTKISIITGIELEQQYAKQSEIKKSSFLHPYRNVWMDIYNSTIQINTKDTVQIYHKSKLVPGVEGGFPFYSTLKKVFGENLLDFGGTTISLGVSEKVKVFKNSFNKAIIAPTICYESVFGEKTAEFVLKGANAIFVSTNDSWWQNSQGHKQLLVYAKLRAIENRRDVARSANSGVSCFINQRGDITSFLPYQTQGFLKGKMKLNNEKTFYTKYGDYIARIALLFMSFVIAYYFSMLILAILNRTKKP